MIQMKKTPGFGEESAEISGLARVSRKKLGDLLIAKKLISQADLDRALEIQRSSGGRLGEVLIKEGLVPAEDVLSIIALQSNVPIVELKDQRIDSAVLSLVPEELARRAIVMPLELENENLVLAMAFPDDIQTVRDIATRSGKRVQIVLALSVGYFKRH